MTAALTSPIVAEELAPFAVRRFTVEESTNLAVLLRAGALPAELTFLEERTIGPELGQDSIDAGRIAGAVGLVAMAAFMITAESRLPHTPNQAISQKPHRNEPAAAPVVFNAERRPDRGPRWPS